MNILKVKRGVLHKKYRLSANDIYYAYHDTKEQALFFLKRAAIKHMSESTGDTKCRYKVLYKELWV